METTSTDTHHSPVFVYNKLGSLLAFAPLGLWTLVHVWNNLASLSGAEAWQASVTQSQHPIALVVTTLVVLFPLLLHTLWGLGRLWTARINNQRYGTFDNLKYLLQRVSAIGVLGFLGAHIWLAFLHPRIVEGHPEAFADLASEMHHNPPTLIVYLLGTLGVAYHLGNGLFGFAWSWGLATSRKALRGFGTAAVVLFVVVLLMSWGAIYGLWSAGASYAPPVG